MKPEIERVRRDLDTMEQALGVGPSMGKAWLEWMKAQKWFSLWWGLPGLIIMARTFLPVDDKALFARLNPSQWAGILASVAMLAVTMVFWRKVSSPDGKPDGLVRELKRIHGMDQGGLWFALTLVAQFVAYFVWAKEYHIGFHPLWSGLFVVMGSSYLIASVAAKIWTLLGWAIPFLAYGCSLRAVEGHARAGILLLGAMFLAIGLSFSLIAAFQVWLVERRRDTDQLQRT